MGMYCVRALGLEVGLHFHSLTFALARENEMPSPTSRTQNSMSFKIFRANRCVSHADLLPYEQTGSEMQSEKADLGYSRQK